MKLVKKVMIIGAVVLSLGSSVAFGDDTKTCCNCGLNTPMTSGKSVPGDTSTDKTKTSTESGKGDN